MFDSIEIAELQAKVRIRVIDDDEDFLKSLNDGLDGQNIQVCKRVPQR